MGVTYNVRQARGVTIADLSGRITLNETIASGSGLTLHGLIRDLLKQGYKNILLNLRDVTYLDSTGIGELFGALTTVQSHGGVLKVSNPTERVLDLLRLTKLNTVLDVMEDEAAAVQSFAREGAA
jgi:anti-sigma B factor antagonist